MLSITVTTQAGIHHKWKKSEPSDNQPLPTSMWVCTWIICGFLLIRGIVKTFKNN
jgi:hypothetical protein